MSVPTRRIEGLLAERIGLDAASIGHDEVGRAVRHRMRETGTTSAEEYLALALASAEEWEELVELVLVPETWFFREPSAFECLRQRAARHMAGGQPRRLRVLSLPCATGEEAYSAAIALHEAGLEPDRFRVDGVDISHRAIARAREGVYRGRSLRHVDAARLRRFFESAGDSHRVCDETRATIEFQTGNLVDSKLLATAAPYDVVFCRNVLIYFGDGTRRRVLDTLARLVRDDGVLLTGHAESQRLVGPVFVSARVPRTFAYRKARVPDTPSPAPAASSAPPATARPVLVPPHQSTAGQGSGRTAPRGGQADSGAEELLARATRLADEGMLDQARETVERVLASRPGLADAHYLLGVVELASGRQADAERALRRAVYLEPAHEAALTQLSLARQRRGDPREAALLRRRVTLARGRTR